VRKRRGRGKTGPKNNFKNIFQPPFHPRKIQKAAPLKLSHPAKICRCRQKFPIGSPGFPMPPAGRGNGKPLEEKRKVFEAKSFSLEGKRINFEGKSFSFEMKSRLFQGK
jgi:hypothetical protein